jgi:hypothetical protein
VAKQLALGPSVSEHSADNGISLETDRIEPPPIVDFQPIKQVVDNAPKLRATIERDGLIRRESAQNDWA